MAIELTQDADFFPLLIEFANALKSPNRNAFNSKVHLSAVCNEQAQTCSVQQRAPCHCRLDAVW